MQELRDAQRRDPDLRIYTHGEKEAERYEDCMKNGIDVNINTVLEMKNLCEYLGMDSVKYLGDVDTSDAKNTIDYAIYK